MSRRFGLPGKIYFIEAGSADGLSENVSNILRQAEVVVHDDFIAQDALELVPTSTLVLNLDKTAATETPLLERMISYAEEGKMVVRLTGPNQLFSGRVEEETRSVREADLSIEIFPAESATAATA